MATPVTVTVGLGKTYSDLNDLAANYLNKDLVAQDIYLIAECYAGANLITGICTFNKSSWTTDNTRYIEIQAAAGNKHPGYYDETKAYAKNTSGDAIRNLGCYLRFIDMQIRVTAAEARAYYASGSGATICRHYFKRTIVSSAIATGNAYAARIESTPNVFYAENSQFSASSGNSSCFPVVTTGGTYEFYNCDLVGSITTSSVYAFYNVSSTITTQNCYLGATLCYFNGGGATFNKGVNDATSNAEAVTANLRSIPYTTATFLNVTPGSENLRLVVSASNKLIDNGANLSGQGIVDDIIGTARPQFGAFDIGEFENDTPICWNYTAQYKNSSRLFKASGCGLFPRALRVPGNVDSSTGRMVDDGVEIDPSEYEVI